MLAPGFGGTGSQRRPPPSRGVPPACVALLEHATRPRAKSTAKRIAVTDTAGPFVLGRAAPTAGAGSRVVGSRPGNTVSLWPGKAWTMNRSPSRWGWATAIAVAALVAISGCGSSNSSGGTTGGSGGASGGSGGASGGSGGASGGSGGASGGSGGASGGSGGQAGGAPSCHDGTQNNGEKGVDCGGSCPNQDCCTNGYADVGGGETGVDCGGSCGACSGAKTYFVASNGNDSNSGTLPTTPWKTIDKVNKSSFKPGDSILFRRGDTWREALSITSSGSKSAYITYGAYGQGARPRILGSERATGWTQVSGHANVWQSGNTLAEPNVGKASSIFFGEKSGGTSWGRVQQTDAVPQCGSGYSLLTQEYDWCWQNSHIFVYSPADPSTRYDFVEVPQRRAAISMPSHAPAQYITVDGLELMYTTMYGYDDGWPMDSEVHGLNIQNCSVGYIGIQGGSAAMGLQIWHSDMVVRNNVIHDSGRRNISYNVYLDSGRSHPKLTFSHVVFDGNVLYHGFHTTGLDISCEPGTAGTTLGDTLSDFTIRNNFIWDDPADDPQDNPNDFTSQGIYLWGEAATFTNFRVYNNVVKDIKQKLLVLYNVTNTAVFNNTFYGMNAKAGQLGTGSAYRGMVTVAGSPKNLDFDNNILYGNVASSQYHLQCVTFSGSSASGVTSMDHNLYFQEHADQSLVSTPSGSFNMSGWSAYQSSGLGFDQNSPTPADPHFVDPAKNDFALQKGSPAIDHGADMQGRTTDFLGNPIQGKPDIGAVEYQP